jgi:hypothetical protein
MGALRKEGQTSNRFNARESRDHSETGRPDDDDERANPLVDIRFIDHTTLKQRICLVFSTSCAPAPRIASISGVRSNRKSCSFAKMQPTVPVQGLPGRSKP